MLAIDLSNINKGDIVGVALSGGKDSVSLLHALFSARNERGYSLVVVNVEHGIRGEESKKDTAFCRALAESYGLPFKSYSVNAPAFAEENGLSEEEAARILRYEKFFEAIDGGFCDKIAVAHHLSDSVETLLFNLFRGSSLSGAKGIGVTRDSGRIIRPLLNATGEEVRLYVDKHALSFVQDKTNLDDNYTRNALRLNVLPIIKELFPRYEAALARFEELSLKDDEFLYDLAFKTLRKEGDRYFIPALTPYPVASRCVITALKALGVRKDYEKVHVDDVLSLSSAISGKKITLPKGVIAVKEGENIVIYRPSGSKPSPIPFLLGKIVFGEYEITCEKLPAPPESFTGALYFDGDKLPDGALFRVKEAGDEFKKFGGGTVSLKKYLTDLKFPESRKSSTPVIAKGKTVFCVCEKDISSLLAIDKSTVNIIKLTCIKRKR